ncbi:unnamed protein product [Paramecium octaurelia]|nr:unnamed protein product [Paramecium octaurelia]
MSANQQANQQELSDEEFMKLHAKQFYRTHGQLIGSQQQYIPVPKDSNHNGKFTDHLLMATMYRNNSLNTTCDKERWINGSKDWMEHLQ